ncbi:MAG: hypothetical protein FWE41_04695 [Coriobacteriia bacterium]|nr:hypothetical protein [Coriobacteriia bacterium]MCL2749783.1 hypothetical protein [Coriobacteriia bacterium]
MAQQGPAPFVNQLTSDTTKKRSALGVGVTTLVTIIVVVLLTAFSVLSLVSALSSERLSEMAVTQIENYYEADSEATVWYAELDAFAAGLTGSPDEYARQLTSGGYTLLQGSEDTLLVTQRFDLSEFRSLVVTVAINDDKTTTIKQWQS